MTNFNGFTGNNDPVYYSSQTENADGTITNEGTKQAGNSPVIPEGYVMVPESVTPAMAVAGGDMFVKSEQVSDYPTDAARSIYRAMLAAAPQEVK